MSAHHIDGDERLTKTLAEQLKLSLLQIARQAELDPKTNNALDIAHMAQMSLRLIDSYILSTDVHMQHSLILEPISIKSVLYDTANDVTSYARMYGCEVETQLDGKFMPVMGNSTLLRAAFTSLASALIEAQSPSDERGSKVTIATHKHGGTIVAGVFVNQSGLTTDMFRRARALYGSARQPMVNSLPSAAAGVFVADSLFSSIASPLKVAKHNKLNGLATVLLPSRQLHLI